jgi:type I restriction enzyme M protein
VRALANERISMKDIADRLGISLPAVSNWRSRHPSFPPGDYVAGQELFPVLDIAAWLDTRKIPVNKLNSDEPRGTTYGRRFRVKSDLSTPVSALIDDAMWENVLKLRSLVEPSLLADLVLGLFYFAISDAERWPTILEPEGDWFGEAPYTRIDRFIFEEVCGAVSEIIDGAQGESIIAAVITIVDRLKDTDDSAKAFGAMVERFASLDGRKTGEILTPDSLSRLLVEMLDVNTGHSIFDPYCRSGELLASAARYCRSRNDGSSSRFKGLASSWRFGLRAYMNVRLNGAETNVGIDSNLPFTKPKLFARETFDYVLCNPPFGMKPHDRSMQAQHYGPVSTNSGDFLWIQYILSVLNDDGRAAVVMPGGTLFREGREGLVRAHMIEDGVVEAIIALPSQMFVATAVPVTVWLLNRSKDSRRDVILLMDAGEIGHRISRAQRGFSDEDRLRIVETIRRWRERDGYEDVGGFCASIPIREILKEGGILVPARYVGSATSATEPLKSIDEIDSILSDLEQRCKIADVAARELKSKLSVDSRMQGVKKHALIGDVPKHWLECRLSEVCEVVAGPSAVQSASLIAGPGIIPVVTPKDMRHGAIIRDEDYGISQSDAKGLTRYLLRPGDIVCSRTGDLGRRAIVSETQNGWLPSSACLRIRVRRNINPSYLVHYLSHPAVKEWIVRNGGGGVMPSLSTKTLGSLPLIIPPTEVQETIGDILSALNERVILHEMIAQNVELELSAIFLKLMGGDLLL